MRKKWLMDAHLTLFAVFIHRWFFFSFFLYLRKTLFRALFFPPAQKICKQIHLFQR